MLFHNQQLYEQARKAKLGNGTLPQPLEELKCWIADRYKVNVLHIVYDRIAVGPQEERPRLFIIIETKEQCAKLRKDRFSFKPHVKEEVRTHFFQIISALHLLHEYDTSDLHVTFDVFSDEAMNQAATRFLEADKKLLLAEFSQENVWDISGYSTLTVVFYLTAEDAQRNSLNGTNDRISRRCFELVKRYDEFDYLRWEIFQIEFDSKENIDKNYEGSLFNYFR